MGMGSSKLCTASDRRVVPSLTASNDGILPLDAMYEILLRLPAKDLCRLRAVCRRWRSLLSDPEFTAVHGARHPGPFIIARYGVQHDVLVEIIDLSGQSVNKVHRRKEGDFVKSMALGLICAWNPYSGVHQLLNPATGSVYHLTKNMAEDHLTRGLNRSDYCKDVYVFGQVPRTREYKVLRVLLNLLGNEDLFEVCTLNSGSPSSWRPKQGPQISLVPDECVIDEALYFLSEAAYYAVANHSVIETEQEWIVTFDLETEEWRPNIKGPNTFVYDDPNPRAGLLKLANLNGSLVIVHGTTTHLDLWLLIDIEKGIWVKQYSLHLGQWVTSLIMDPLFVLDDGRIVMLVGNMLQIYDPRTNTFSNVLELRHCFGTSMYTGNLLSLDGQNY